ncbi:hypothetical protein ACFRI7_11475 [Streptomyces sp. NPDC056716]|uniref:hypothetical protein n=1 Tax=unclassified Streptomyces TaxID=2593676 RepID=UPI0036A9D4D5
MNENAEQQHPRPTEAGPGYGYGQLAKALATARTHPDADTRRRAEDKGRAWRSVLAGMASGKLLIGSRTPVAGLPAWVTPEVVRGGFATGEPSAGGPLQPYEVEAARRAGIPAERRALFEHFLTEPGLAGLGELLDSGRYEIAVPEEAALLTVAWLARAGQMEAALDLVAELAPFADRLRFTPRPSERPAPDAGAVHRYTAADARHALSRRGPNTAIETQREALTVWAPFADDLLTHWLWTAEDGVVLARTPDAHWLAEGARLLSRYRDLAGRHTYCTKHLDPRENLGVLRTALEVTVKGRRPAPRELGLLRTATAAMVRRRGLPGSAAHTALRRTQAAQAALPSYHALARVLVDRLAALPQDTGVAQVEPLLAPLDTAEARASGLPAGTVVPSALRAPVESVLSAPLDTLVERGVVPSAEVLAELVPQLVAATTAQAYPDDALRTLAAANYRAFRNRRSLLLLDLAHQVRVEELPWVAAVGGERSGTGASDISATALRRLAELAVRAFPGTILPNPLIRELSVLARAAGLDAPLVEELAADIFMGTFSPKFAEAARVAADLLSDTLYARYYGIDYAALAAPADSRERGRRDDPSFALLCTQRAGRSSNGTLTTANRSTSADSPHASWSVPANGKVVEQAQILTTHNLATLVARAGITSGKPDLARRSFTTVCRLTARLHNNPRPLPTIKDTAYAWRQLIFHLSLCTPQDQSDTLDWLYEEATRHAPHVIHRLAPALTGLHRTAEGGTPDEGKGHSLVGWSTDGHWLRVERYRRGRSR